MHSVKRFTGLYPASLTPMNKDGSLNVEVIDPYVKFYGDEGIDGVFLNGTSGESMSLSINERKTITEAWVRANQKYGNRVRIIAHIGTQSVEDTKELARHAQSIGVDAIASMAPAFFKPKTLQQLLEYLGAVAAAADKTPFFYYHYPGITGVDYPVWKVLQEGSKQIPTLQGAKFTSMDLRDLSKCLDLQRFDLLSGYDYVWLPAVSIGSVGAVGIGGNFVPDLFKTIEAYGPDKSPEALDRAQKAQKKMITLFDIVEKHENIIAPFKAIVKAYLGLDFGPVRTPLKNLTEEETKNMLAEIERAGFSLTYNKKQ
jgi:N-acetylneuraminate lyase